MGKSFQTRNARRLLQIVMKKIMTRIRVKTVMTVMTLLRKRLQRKKNPKREEDNKPGTKDGSPKKKLKTKRELDSLRRKSEEKPKEKAKSDNENDEVKCEEDEAGIIKEEDG